MDFELHSLQREIEIDGFNSIYYFEFDKNFSHLPEKHNFWELVYVDSGDITAITDGLGQTLTQGQVIFHKPNEIHAHVSNKKVPNNMLVIAFTSDSPAMAFFDKKVFTLEKTTRTILRLFTEEAARALRKIPSDYENKNPLDFSSSPAGSVQLLECYLIEFLIMLKRSNENLINKFAYSEDTRNAGRNSLLDLIIGYMKENVYTSLSLNEVCAQFLVNKTQLCDLFGNNLGESPISYFNSLKINEAKKLLRADELSVSQIADKLGYVNIHSFSRAFKNQIGFSPSEYKKSLVRDI